MTSERNILKIVLECYISDTYNDIETIQLFTKGCDQWIKDRQAEVQALRDVKDSEKEMGVVLEKMRTGLKEVQIFLDAAERLAVTSAHVFQTTLFAGADQTLCLHLQTARNLSPLLLLFKLDYEKLFSPKVLNKDVFQDQLRQIIRAVQVMCVGWKDNFSNNFNSNHLIVDLRDSSEEAVKQMLLQIRRLDALRKDQNFRMVYLFKDRSQSFREKFSEVKPQMQQLMLELEGCAQQLDSMNFGARISGTVSSSVGIVAGVLSIAGLIAAPFTAGASLALSAAGAVVGVTSGVQGIVTTTTELGVNNTQTNKAEEAFDKCVRLLNDLQDFLNDVIQQHFKHLKENLLRDVIEAIYSGAVFADSIAGLGGIIYKQLKNGAVAADAVYDAAEGAVAVVRVGTRAARIVECVRIGAGVLNGVFAGVDGYFLYRDVQSLVDGTETELSKIIRARVALWSSEMESWQKIHDSLLKGEKVYDEYKKLLQKPFVPV